MSNIKYVIRTQDFSRGFDEYLMDSVTAGKIHSIYEDRDAAIEAWKKLVVDAVRENDLYHYDIQDKTSEDVLKKADLYLQEQLGISLFEEYGRLIDFIPHNLNDDATFELAKKLNFLHYQLYEFAKDTDYYVVWLYDDELYLRFGHPDDPDNFHNDPDYYTDYVGKLIYGTHENFIAENKIFMERLIERIKFNSRHNSFDPFSENSELFEQILNSDQTTWEVNRLGRLSLKRSPTYQEIITINNLLKSPFFEIRKINLDTLIDFFNQETEM